MKKNFYSSVFCSIFFALLFFWILPSSVEAATLYWVGDDGANTSVASNWKTTNPAACGSGDAGAAPGSSDSVVFDPDCDNGATINSAISTNGIDVQSGYIGTITQSAAVTIEDFSLTLTGGTWNGAGQTVNFIGGNSDTQTLTCSTTFSPTVSIAQTVGNNSFTLSSNCTITLAASNSTTGSITNNGTMNATDITMTSSSDFTQSGTFNLSGTLKFSGASTNSQELTCTGNLTASGGVVNIAQTSSATTFTLNSGCIVTFQAATSTSGTIVNNGTINHNSGSPTLSAGAITNNSTYTYTGTAISITNGNFTQSGTFNLSGITVTFSGGNSATQTLTCSGTLGGTVSLAQTVGGNTFTLSSNCTITLAASNTTTGSIANNGTMNVTDLTMSAAGNAYTLTQSGTFNLSGTLQFGGTTTNTLTCTNPISGGTVVVNKTSAGSFTLGSSCTVNNFTRTDGVFNNPGSAMTLTVLGDFSMSTTDAFAGTNLTLKMAPTSGTESITQNAGTMSGLFSVETSGGASVSMSTAFTTGSTCNVVEGIFDLNSFTFTCGSTYTVEDGGTMELFGSETTTAPTLNSGSTVKYTGNGTGSLTAYTLNDYAYHHLTIASVDATDTFATPNSTEDVNGNFTLSEGVFTAPSGAFTIAGNFAHSGGTFTHNAGTVTLDGTGQQISGSTTFHNLTKITSSTDTLTFAASTTQTVTTTWTAQGAASNLLSLRSSSTGNQWHIDPQNTRTLSYLDVKDSNNTNSTFINAIGTNSINAENNTNWDFATPDSPSSLGPAGLVNGSDTADTTPEVTFSLSDPDVSDTVKYQIQIDDSSNFGSVVLDFTSSLQAQGSAAFTVGQLAGGGTYATGSSGQILVDGSYYWRAKTIDLFDIASAFSTANSGAVAFVVDTTTPTPTIVPSSSSGTSSVLGSTTNPPSCQAAVPGATPVILYGVVPTSSTTMTLYFTDGADPYNHYTLAYGTKSGEYTFGQDDIGEKGMRTYTVQHLHANTTYYFRVRTGNGCAPGPWSNEIAATTFSLGAYTSLPLTITGLVPVVKKQIPSPAKQVSKVKPTPTKTLAQRKRTVTSTPTVPQKKYKVEIAVVDTKQQPVVGAEVTMHSTPQTKKTDTKGVATFSNIEQGQHKVIIAYAGFTGEQSIFLSGQAELYRLSIQISPINIFMTKEFLLVVGGLLGVITILIVLLLKKR